MRVTEITKAGSADLDALTFARLALALAMDYESVYVIRIADDHYVEYRAEGEDHTLVRTSEGDDFYADTVINTQILVHPDDREGFLHVLKKKNVLAAVGDGGSFTWDYRLIATGVPLYYSLKIVRGTGEDRPFIIIGVRNVDAEKRRAMAEAAEHMVFGEIAQALARRYEVIYYVDIETGEYTEYSASEKYKQLAVGNHGTDFFTDTQRNMQTQIHPEDLQMMSESMQRENLLDHMRETGTTTLNYRLLLDGKPQYVTLFAIRPQEDSQHIILAVANIDAAKRREIEYREALGTAIDMAKRDALTGVKNMHAYALAVSALDEAIREGMHPEFSVVVCDINGLKTVNDTQGHSAGDAFIRSACTMICMHFKHSPVYRIGGDEFAVLLKGQDHDAREALISALRAEIAAHREQGLVTVACGISDFVPQTDSCVRDVFKRADEAMYECKKRFKQCGII